MSSLCAMRPAGHMVIPDQVVDNKVKSNSLSPRDYGTRLQMFDNQMAYDSKLIMIMIS
jgi:hypothetical protein